MNSSGRVLASDLKAGLIMAPGIYDAITARLVEAAGFRHAYLTGAGVSMSVTAAPDLGITSLTEMAGRLGEITQSSDLLVIADADTGFGGPLSVRRTVQLYEAAGAAALQLEDQVAPKRCGHESPTAVVSVDAMRSRLGAALSARREDVLIIARTDARGVEGLDAAIERAQSYAAEGADLVFIEALRDQAELTQVGAADLGVPLVANMVEGGETPLLTAAELCDLGYRLIIHPNTLLRTFILHGARSLNALRAQGTTDAVLDTMASHDELWTLFQRDQWEALADRHSSD